MFKKIVSKSTAVVLVLCMLAAMLPMTVLNASAAEKQVSPVSGALADAGIEKLIELGVRGACELTLGMSELLNEDQQEVVDSFCSWILMDASEAAIVEVQELCEEILNELYEVERKLDEYSIEITSDIQGTKVAEAKQEYLDCWTTSFDDVLVSKNSYMDDVYKHYVKYLVVSNLNQNGYPTDPEKIKMLQNFAQEYKFTITEEDTTDEGVAKAKKDLVKSFCDVYSSTNTSESMTYSHTYVNGCFIDTISSLTDELMGSEIDHNLISCAATYAYFALPYEHQQYDFVFSVAKNQIMKIVLLEMAYNEFLSCQGEYLYENYGEQYPDWADQLLLIDVANDNQQTPGCSYNSLKTAMVGSEETTGLLEKVTSDIGDFLNSTIYINVTSDTGTMKDIQTSLGQYIKPEDAVSVNLTINGFADEYNYSSELSKNNQVDDLIHISGNTNITKKNQITSSTLRFIRVMPGNESDKVYYILDPAQFSSPLESKNIVHRIVRVGPLGGSDSLYGDIYVASNDYLNLKKNMSDGANTYVSPQDLQNSIKDLFDTSAFEALYKYNTYSYLSEYIYSGDPLYLMSSKYSISYNGGASLVKSGDVVLQKLNEKATASMEFAIGSYDLEDDLYNEGGNYTVILNNTSNDYLQNVNLAWNGAEGSVQDFKVVYNDSEIALGSSGKIKSGEKIVVKFKLDENSTVASLKCLRNNTTQSETVLIDDNDVQCFEKDSDGYYTFDYYMPYSNCTFVLETKEKPLEKDENGCFIIRTYDDLCKVAKYVNTGDEIYTKGNYIVANDIVCPEDENWNLPIGTEENPFMGTFDGQGYTIATLTSDSTDYDEFGLFGIISGAEIKNVNIDVNFNLEGSNDLFVGGLFAINGDYIYNQPSEIYNCTVSGNMFFDRAADVGGISGYLGYMSTIEKCINKTNISGEYISNLGGIAGINRGLINNCANHGELSATESYWIGGIAAGDASTSNTITNCYNVGNILCDDYSAKGAISTNEKQVDNCYYLKTVNIGAAKSESKTQEQFENGEVTYLLNKGVEDGTQVWYQNIDYAQPYDKYPLFDKTENNTVYKVDYDNKEYSNTRVTVVQASLEKEDLRTYLRPLEGEYNVHFIYGYGEVEGNVITAYVNSQTSSLGIPEHQGKDGKAGVIKLVSGEYPVSDLSSSQLLANGTEEPPVYTDANGCIFINVEDKITNAKEGDVLQTVEAQYTENGCGTTTYTLNVVYTEQLPPRQVIQGNIINDPDYEVIKGYILLNILNNYGGEIPTEPPTEVPTEPSTEVPTEPSTETPTEPSTQAPTQTPTQKPTASKDATSSTVNTNKGNSVVPTGDVIYVVPVFAMLLLGLVLVISYKRKKQ